MRACNPYLMLACVLSAGIDGIKNDMKLVNDDEYIKKLPRTMEEAIKAFKEDSFIQNVIGNCLSEKIISRKNKEWKEYCRAGFFHGR